MRLACLDVHTFSTVRLTHHHVSAPGCPPDDEECGYLHLSLSCACLAVPLHLGPGQTYIHTCVLSASTL